MSRVKVRRALAGITAAVLGAGLVAPASVAASTPVSAPEPVRILLIGDSLTHGSSGDWTWRYRLAEQLRVQGVDFDLVGPADDLSSGSMDYIDADFDREHAALWGMTAAQPRYDARTLIADHEPDVVIEMLGVNDLAWGALPAETVIEHVASMTRQIRSEDPGVDVLVSEVPAAWIANAVEFNDRLSTFAAGDDSPGARTVLVDTDRDYVRDQHTYDYVHPSSVGEQALAFAALDALAEIGVGSGSPAIVPVLPLGPRLTPTLAGRAGVDSVSLEWSSNRGSDRQYVWWRDVADGAVFARIDEPVAGTSTTVVGLSPGHRYELELQPAKGVHVAAGDVRSNRVAVVLAAPPAPVEPPAPSEPPAPLEPPVTNAPAPSPASSPPPVPTQLASPTPQLLAAPESGRPRLSATRLPRGRVRLEWRRAGTPGPVEIQVRMSGTWQTWRVVGGARDALVTRVFAHRPRTSFRVRASSGATSRVVIIRRR